MQQWCGSLLAGRVPFAHALGHPRQQVGAALLQPQAAAASMVWLKAGVCPLVSAAGRVLVRLVQ
jgi:hypothetical protein